MENSTIVFLLALAAVLLYAMLRRTPRAGAEEGALREVPASGPYHAVEVRAAEGACELARAIRGVRFLSAEAPSIPLPSCTTGRCACVYVHHADRRVGQRRDAYLHGAYRQGERQDERRRTPRRLSDRLAIGAER